MNREGPRRRLSLPRGSAHDRSPACTPNTSLLRAIKTRRECLGVFVWFFEGSGFYFPLASEGKGRRAPGFPVSPGTALLSSFMPCDWTPLSLMSCPNAGCVQAEAIGRPADACWLWCRASVPGPKRLMPPEATGREALPGCPVARGAQPEPGTWRAESNLHVASWDASLLRPRSPAGARGSPPSPEDSIRSLCCFF